MRTASRACLAAVLAQCAVSPLTCDWDASSLASRRRSRRRRRRSFHALGAGSSRSPGADPLGPGAFPSPVSIPPDRPGRRWDNRPPIRGARARGSERQSGCPSLIKPAQDGTLFQILSDSPKRVTPNDARTQRTRDACDGAMESDTYDDDFEVSDDSITVEMASAVKPNATDTPSTTKSKKVATDASNAPRSRAPGSLTADLRSVAVPASSPAARSSKTGQPRAVALLARRSASKDPSTKPTNDASLNVKPKIPSDTAQMRLSSAFEKTLDTWHDRDGVAADNLSLQTQVDAQLAEMAGLQLKCQSLEAAAMADRERASEHAKSLENAVAKERKLRLEADRAAADAKASATPWGQMAKGNVDVKCVSTAEAVSLS